MEHALELPTFDIEFALAVATVYQRYIYRIRKKLEHSPGTPYIRAVAEHTVRIQRLSEGLTAFTTAGVCQEQTWFCRPCVELYASQCILQFAHVNHPIEMRSMTLDEKADSYWTHGLFVQKGFLSKHKSWQGQQYSEQERQLKLKEIETELSKKPYKYRSDKAWHQMDLGAAFKRGEKAKTIAMGESKASDISKIFPVAKDYMDKGIHGSSFSAKWLNVSVAPGVSEIQDIRTPNNDGYTSLPTLLAFQSLEMLAHVFHEAYLILPMLESAVTEGFVQQKRYVTHFPTALVHLCALPSE